MIISSAEMSNGSRSFKVVLTAARRCRDLVSDVTDDVTRRFMSSTMTSASLTVSTCDRIADHASSARRLRSDVTFCDVIKTASYGDVTSSNDVTAVRRSQSDVL